ncbi:MAG: single-stranded DNA-binding protein [Candidatus Omnitrophota bacterium]
MNLNTVNIFGNLTRDPELRALPSGKSVCRISIANNRVFTKNGEKATEVSYFDVDVWGTIAENCVKYLKKGAGVIVEGRLRQDRWEKEGKPQSRVTITANAVHFMPRKTEGGAPASDRGGDRGNERLDEVSGPEAIAWEE